MNTEPKWQLVELAKDPDYLSLSPDQLRFCFFNPQAQWNQMAAHGGQLPSAHW